MLDGPWATSFVAARWCWCWSLLLVSLSCSCGALETGRVRLTPLERFLFGARVAEVRERVLATRDDDDDDARPWWWSSSSSSSSLTVIFPGAGGPDALTSELRDRLAEDDVGGVAAVHDWSKHRGGVLTAAYDGEAVGDALADLLSSSSSSSSSSLERLHCVGVSVGAFPANRLVESVRDRVGAPSPRTRLTLLDPFCARGVLSIPGLTHDNARYGRTYFGAVADEAVHYLNTDDPVPTTNEPLSRHCVVYDVTGAPERANFALPSPDETMHCWPVAYYARHGRRRESARHERGDVVTVR